LSCFFFSPGVVLGPVIAFGPATDVLPYLIFFGAVFSTTLVVVFCSFRPFSTLLCVPFCGSVDYQEADSN